MKRWSALMIGLALLGGCREMGDGRAAESHMNAQVLGFSGCPHSPEFLARVEAAAQQVGGIEVEYIDQESLPETDLRRGYPAPTALVNGRDLFGLPAPDSPSMGCRVYAGGLPATEAIAERLRAMLKR